MVSFRKLRLPRLLPLAAGILLSGIMVQSGDAQENRGTVVGTVTAEDTGVPLSGTNVFIVGTGLANFTGR